MSQLGAHPHTDTCSRIVDQIRKWFDDLHRIRIMGSNGAAQEALVQEAQFNPVMPMATVTVQQHGEELSDCIRNGNHEAELKLVNDGTHSDDGVPEEPNGSQQEISQIEAPFAMSTPATSTASIAATIAATSATPIAGVAAAVTVTAAPEASKRESGPPSPFIPPLAIPQKMTGMVKRPSVTTPGLAFGDAKVQPSKGTKIGNGDHSVIFVGGVFVAVSELNHDLPVYSVDTKAAVRKAMKNSERILHAQHAAEKRRQAALQVPVDTLRAALTANKDHVLQLYTRWDRADRQKSRSTDAETRLRRALASLGIEAPPSAFDTLLKQMRSGDGMVDDELQQAICF